MNKPRRIILIFLFGINLISYSQTRREQKKFWKKIAEEIPEYECVFKKNKKYRFEIIYGQINRNLNKKDEIKKYRFGDANTYFYPASTVKLPIALRTFQLINTIKKNNTVPSGDWYLYPIDTSFCGGKKYLNRQNKYLKINAPISVSKAANLCGMNLEKFIFTNGFNDSTVCKPGEIIRANSSPENLSVNEMISEMLMYSNNDYYNILFDFSNGEKAIVEKDLKIAHRFTPCIGDDVEESTAMKAIALPDSTVYFKERKSITDRKKVIFKKGLKVGKAVKINDNKIENRPKNFSQNNAVKLETLMEIIVKLVNPDTTENNQFYSITPEQRMLLIRYLGMRPSEDKIVSSTDCINLPENYTNYLYTGQGNYEAEKNIRIVNIVGKSYGFITDCMYFADENSKTDFFLAARIYVNEDGILNDDKYEYDEIAFPLFEKLGKKIFEFEKKRKKEFTQLPSWLLQSFR